MRKRNNLCGKKRWARKFIRKHGISVGDMLINTDLVKFAADDVAPGMITELTFYYPEDKEEYEKFIHDYEIDMKAGGYHMANCRKAWFYSQFNELNIPDTAITDILVANIMQQIRLAANYTSDEE